MLELGVGVGVVGGLRIKGTLHIAPPGSWRTPHGKFLFHRCNCWEVKFLRGLVSGVRIGDGGRGLKGTWHRTLSPRNHHAKIQFDR